MMSRVVLVMLLFAANGYCFRLKQKDEGCSAPMDFALVLQSSRDMVKPLSSVNWWSMVKNYTNKLVDDLEEISENGTHVGIITFGANPEVNLKLNRYTGAQLNAKNIQRDIGALKLLGGSSRIDKALKEANTKIFTGVAGMRKHAVKVCVVVTNGIQDNFFDMMSASQPLKDKDVNVLSVGFGYDMDVMNMIQIASTPNYVWSLTNIASTVEAIKKLKQRQC